jgi:thiamine biosynthesis lipoprotein
MLGRDRCVLQPGGVQFDLSSVAKGFAVDRVSHALRDLGAADHLVEIGGELRGSGTKPDGSPWWVALDQPAAGDAGDPACETIVALHGLSVATSGDAQRYFERDGRRWSHTIDPRTGRPVSDRLAAVTVLHPSCMRADALATALTVLGPDGGLDYATACGLAARFVIRRARGIEERITPAFAAMLE